MASDVPCSMINKANDVIYEENLRRIEASMNVPLRLRDGTELPPLPQEDEKEQPVVQELGNGEMLIGPVSSEFAARLLCSATCTEHGDTRSPR